MHVSTPTELNQASGCSIFARRPFLLMTAQRASRYLATLPTPAENPPS